jgi:hypothetical protein
MRVENWNIKLSDYIKSVQNEPFTWGKFDCCLFAANCVEVMTGKDFTENLRYRYNSKITACRVLLDKNYLNIFDMVIKKIGEPKNPLFANRGDVVYYKKDEKESLGICLGDKCVFVGENQLEYIPLQQVECAWSI